MGWQDRPYERNYPIGGPPAPGPGSPGRFTGGGGMGFGRLQPRSVVTWLLVINAIVFILDAILTGSGRMDGLSPRRWGHFSVVAGLEHFQIWRIVTYQFLHGGFFHIFFNMLVLYFFGPMVESWLGSKRFAAFYILCGIGGAALFTLLALTLPGLIFNEPAIAASATLIGASGCIFGILAAAATIAPDQKVMLLIPPIPMKMRTLVLVFLGIAVLSVIAQSANAGGELAHLGGAAVGFLLIKRPGLLAPLADGPSRLRDRVQDAQTQRQDRQRRATDAQIDRILAKVHQNGLNSLTDKEKRILRQATEEKRTG